MGLRFVQGLEADFEAPAGHAQPLHGIGDGRGQAFSSRLALKAQLTRLIHQLPVRPLRLLFQRLQVGRLFQRGQLLFPLGPAFRQRLGRAPVAAGQTQPAGQSLVQRFQRRRIDFGVAGMVLQVMAGVFDLRQGALQRLGQRRIPGFDVLLRLKGLQRPVQALGGTVLVLIQNLQGGLGRVDQTLGVRQAALLEVELLPFPGLWIQFVEFTDLPLQTIPFLLPGGLLLAGGLQQARGVTPVRP